jgi:four helix bundle protein
VFAHENLKVYQKALDYSVDAVRMSKGLTRGYYALADQLVRAATSIPLNIAEGNGKWHIKERINHFRIARASAFECAAILDVLTRLELIGIEHQELEKDKLEEISRMLHVLSEGAKRLDR